MSDPRDPGSTNPTINRLYNKKTSVEVSVKNSCSSVTVPGRLHRVVYIAPQASAGYRGCIPWWRRSHHPGSPCSHSGRSREEADIFFILSSSELPPLLCPLCLASTDTQGLTSPQLVAEHTHSHPHPPLPPRLTCPHPLQRSPAFC